MAWHVPALRVSGLFYACRRSPTVGSRLLRTVVSAYAPSVGPTKPFACPSRCLGSRIAPRAWKDERAHPAVLDDTSSADGGERGGQAVRPTPPALPFRSDSNTSATWRAVDMLWHNSAGLVRETRATSRRCLTALKVADLEPRLACAFAELVLTERLTILKAVATLSDIASRLRTSLAAATARVRSDAPAQEHERLLAEACALYSHLFVMASDVLRAGLNNAASADKLLVMHKRKVMAAIARAGYRGVTRLDLVHPDVGAKCVAAADAVFASACIPPELAVPAASGAASGSDSVIVNEPVTPGAAVWQALTRIQTSGAATCGDAAHAVGSCVAEGTLPPAPVALSMRSAAESDGAAATSVLVCTSLFMELLTKAVTVDVDAAQHMLSSLAASRFVWGQAHADQLVAGLGTTIAAAQMSAHIADRMTFAWNTVILRYRQFNELPAAVTAHQASQRHAEHMMAALEACVAAVTQVEPADLSEPAPLLTAAVSGTTGTVGEESVTLEYVEADWIDTNASSHSSTSATSALSHLTGGARSQASVNTHSGQSATRRLTKHLQTTDARRVVRLQKRSTCVLGLVLPTRMVSDRNASRSTAASEATTYEQHETSLGSVGARDDDDPSDFGLPSLRAPVTTSSHHESSHTHKDAVASTGAWTESSASSSDVDNDSVLSRGVSDDSDADTAPQATDDSCAGVDSLGARALAGVELIPLSPGIHLFAAPVDTHLVRLRRLHTSATATASTTTPSALMTVRDFVEYVEGVITDAARLGVRLDTSIGRMLAILYRDADRAVCVSTSVGASRPRAHPCVRHFAVDEQPSERRYVRDAALWLIRFGAIFNTPPDARLIAPLLVTLAARATSKLHTEGDAWWRIPDGSAAASSPAYFIAASTTASAASINSVHAVEGSGAELPLHCVPITPLSLEHVVTSIQHSVPGDDLALRLLAHLAKGKHMRGTGNAHDVNTQLLCPAGLTALTNSTSSSSSSSSTPVDKPSGSTSTAQACTLFYVHVRCDDALRSIRVLAQAVSTTTTLPVMAGSHSPSSLAALINRAHKLAQARAASILQLLNDVAAYGLLSQQAVSRLSAAFEAQVEAAL